MTCCLMKKAVVKNKKLKKRVLDEGLFKNLEKRKKEVRINGVIARSNQRPLIPKGTDNITKNNTAK